MEERAGERRCVLLGHSPLLNPLPARFSWGEEGAAQDFESASGSGQLRARMADAVSRRDGGGTSRASFALGRGCAADSHIGSARQRWRRTGFTLIAGAIKSGGAGSCRTADFPVCCVADFQIGGAALIRGSLANRTARRLEALRHSRLGSLRYHSRSPHPLTAALVRVPSCSPPSWDLAVLPTPAGCGSSRRRPRR